MMTNDSEKLLDETGWELLCALQENARMSYADLGRRVGLTPPAVADRIRRLEAAGIITRLSRGGESGEARSGADGDHPLQGVTCAR